MLLIAAHTPPPVYTTGEQVLIAVAAVAFAVLGLWIKGTLARKARRYR
jgi:hypothetical protein